MTDSTTLAGLWLDGDDCAVDIREAWALSGHERADLHQAARAEGIGLCVVSTCFRIEVALAGRRPAAELLAWARRRLASLRPDLDPSEFRSARGTGAARHLFRVAAGLESAILGEAQILGQVRRARAEAEEAGALAPELRETLDAAIRVSQWARGATDLGRGTASTASAAVQWADDAIGGLAGRRVVVVGAGQIGRLLLTRLAAVEAASLTLVSAHAPSHLGFEVVRPADLAEVLPLTDVVFTATDRSVLDAEIARQAWVEGAPRAVVDLGVPRNVGADVGAIEGVALADIDALGAVVDAGLAARQAAIPTVEARIDQAVRELDDALVVLERERLVGDFRRRAEAIRQETLSYVCSRCDDRTCAPSASDAGVRPGPGPCSDPDGLTRTLTTRLLHDVTAALRNRPEHADDDTIRALLSLPDAGG
jgi:glutamyl-tRNA reductase